MILGVMSDSHSNTGAIEKALSIFREHDISVILHAGDFGSPDNLALFRNYVLHLVKGNTDNLEELQFYAEKYGQAAPLESKKISFQEKSIFLYHGDNSGLYREALKENYNYIVRGHSHFPEDIKMEKTRVLNPGALYRCSQYTVGILDTNSNNWSIMNLKGERINEKIF